MTDITKGFYFDKDGLYFEDKDKKNNIEHIWICSRLEVVALTRTAESTAWGRLIRIKDLDGKIKYWIMPANLLSNDGRQYREELLDRGLIIGPGKKSPPFASSVFDSSKTKCKSLMRGPYRMA